MQRGQKKPELGAMDKITEMLQKLDIGLNGLRQELATMKEDIKKEFAGLKKDLTDVKQKAEENTKRVEELERGWKGAQAGRKNLESVVLNLQMEKSLLFLRFQNVPEDEGEDLKDKMSKILADFTGKELEWVQWDIDKIYRVNSYYAKTHNVPREIHVKFVKMEMRDEILRAQRGGHWYMVGKKYLYLSRSLKRYVKQGRNIFFYLTNCILKGSCLGG